MSYYEALRAEQYKKINKVHMDLWREIQNLKSRCKRLNEKPTRSFFRDE